MHLTDLAVIRVLDLRDPLPDDAAVKSPFLIVTASNDAVTLGPLVIEGLSVCPKCTRYWCVTAGWDRPAPAPPEEQALEIMHAKARAIAEELASTSVTDHPLLRNVLQVDLPSLKQSFHPVFPRAHCPQCGHLASVEVPLSVHCSPLTGILSSVEVSAAPVAGSYSAIGRYVSPLPLANSRPPLKAQFVMGKGQKKSQAVESCIGEAIERYSITFVGDERLRRLAADSPDFVQPSEILLYSDQQYRNRATWNETHDDRYWVAEPFEPGVPIDWLEAVEFPTKQRVFVPAACCLMWYPFSPGEAKFASADSNGCAAARTYARAALSALLELVERDALAIWWYNQIRRPAMAIESFELPELERIGQSLSSNGRQLFLLDITTDFGIPVYAAVSPAADGAEPLFAAACSYSPRQAAIRAAAEAAQLIFSAVQSGGLDRELHAWLHSATLKKYPYLVPTGLLAAPTEPPAAGEEQVLQHCVARITSRGFRTIFVDQSRPDVSLKTVRAIVPGLRHIWARFAPGRLYQVPFQCGWLDKPLEEERLNSILCMI